LRSLDDRLEGRLQSTADLAPEDVRCWLAILLDPGILEGASLGGLGSAETVRFNLCWALTALVRDGHVQMPADVLSRLQSPFLWNWQLVKRQVLDRLKSEAAYDGS